MFQQYIRVEGPTESAIINFTVVKLLVVTDIKWFLKGCFNFIVNYIIFIRSGGPKYSGNEKKMFVPSCRT